jgi:hypothetical protein
MPWARIFHDGLAVGAATWLGWWLFDWWLGVGIIGAALGASIGAWLADRREELDRAAWLEDEKLRRRFRDLF